MSQKVTQFFNKTYPVIVILTIVTLIGVSLYSSFLTFQSTEKKVADLAGEDMVTAWEKRWRKVRLILPENGVIGYLADWDIPDYVYGAKDQEIEFILAQYTVAPLVLTRGIDHKIILGNFNDNGDKQKIQNIQDHFGIQLLNRFSNEIFVFTGKGQ